MIHRMAVMLTRSVAVASFAAMLLTPISFGQGPGSFDGCPLEGQTTRRGLMALNRLKNRTQVPFRTDVNPNISLNSVLAPGNDLTRWSTSQAAIITGYVVAVKPGGPETVNCGATDPAHTDTHIELALNVGDSQGIHHMIVEVTPRGRAMMTAKGKDWSTANLKRSLLGLKITVVGWMTLDKEHCNASENTNAGAPHNWRATCWEIHPVVGLARASQ